MKRLKLLILCGLISLSCSLESMQNISKKKLAVTLEKESYWGNLKRAAQISLGVTGLVSMIYLIGIPLERRYLISFDQLKNVDEALATCIGKISQAVNIDPSSIEYNLSGREFAAISPTIYPTILNLNPPELKKITDGMASFCIAHELIHIKKYHVAKNIIYLLMTPFINLHFELASKYYAKFIDQSIFSLQKKFGYENNWLINKFRNVHSLVATSQITHFLIQAYVWKKILTSFEREADIEAAIALKSAKGGMDCFGSIISSSNIFMRFLKKYIDPHPSDIERFMYLYRLQKKFDVQLS